MSCFQPSKHSICPEWTFPGVASPVYHLCESVKENPALLRITTAPLKWQCGLLKFCNSTCLAGKVVRHWQPANIMQCRIQEVLPAPTVSSKKKRKKERPGDSTGRNEAAESAPWWSKRDSPASLGFKTFLGWMQHSQSFHHIQDKSVIHKSVGIGVWQEAR